MASFSPIEISAQSELTAGLWTFAVAGLIWLQTLWMRRRQARESRIEAEVTARWHPMLSLASFGVLPDSLPPLRRCEQAAFLKLWVYLQTSLRGKACAALAEIACALQCDVLVMRMLASRKRGDRLLATVASGHLGLERALPLLHSHTRSNDSVLSLQALQSILRIDSGQIASLAPLCVQREDWPVPQLLPALRDCGEAVTAPLLAALDQPCEHGARRAVQLVAGLRLSPELAQQQALLLRTSPGLLAESLALIDRTAMLDEVRALLAHDDNRVRAAAVEALIRIGDGHDLAVMPALLADRSWRVRNAAARAIVALPGGGQDKLAEIAAASPSEAARQMAEHVRAERQLLR